MSADPPPPPEVRNLYRRGRWDEAVRAWRQRAEQARWIARNPRDAARAFPGWLRGSLRRDRDFFAGGARGAAGLFRAGLHHPVHRRWILGLFALAGFSVGFGYQRCGISGCPDVGRLASMQPGSGSVILDARGNRLAELDPVRWEVVSLGDLPEIVPQAFVAVEDKRFHDHHGVDWRRFLGQTARNAIPGGRAAGASTITMQLARNVFPDRLPASDRTVRRKLLEIRVAREIEDRYTKDEILQTYLNHIYFGEGVYGIQSAARVYFGKNAADLALPEAALLAGLLRAPTNYNPRTRPEAALRRRNVALGLMAAQGRITPAQAEAARATPLRLARWAPERRPRTRSGYFVDRVRRAVEDALGERAYQGGLRIHTTLDPRVQAAAEEQLESQLRAVERGAFGRFRGPRRAAHEEGAAETEYLQGAVLVMDARDGGVRAWVGGRSYAESRFDRLAQGLRQPGSAFKPVVFAAAVEAGVMPADTLPDDSLTRVLPGGEVWKPRNFDGRFRGPVTFRRSARQSVNTTAVLLAERVGLGTVADEARRLGITTEIPPLPSVAIGAAAVRPVELARAYTPFATLGRRVDPRFLDRVEDRDGRVLHEARPRSRRVLEPAVAFLVTSMLRDVVDRGTGTRARGGVRGPVAGKTGTTNGATDAWFVGYTPELVGLVWIGFDRPRPIVAEGSGGTLAAPVWGRVIARAQGREPALAWEPPAGVAPRRVTADGMQVIAPGCRARRETYPEFFLRGHVPPTVCPRGEEAAEPGLAGWWNRTAGERWTRLREWSRDVWADLRRAVGLPVDEAPAPAAPPPERPEPLPAPVPDDTAFRVDTMAADTVLPEIEPELAPAPVDTVRLPPAAPSAPPDTVVLPPAGTVAPEAARAAGTADAPGVRASLGEGARPRVREGGGGPRRAA